MKPRLLLLTMTFAALAPAIGSIAHADGKDARLEKPGDARASEHLTQGNRHYRLREFDKAIEEYKAGALIEDTPVFLYNLGQAYRQAGKYEEAIWHYERFLARAHPTGEIKEAVDGFITNMRDELAKAASHKEPTEPAPEGLPSGPANSLVPSPPTPTETPGLTQPVENTPAGMSGRRKFAIAFAATGLVAAGAGFVFGLRARGFENDAADLCPMDSCERADEANALLRRGNSSALYANIGFGVGAAAVVGATVLWLTGAAEAPSRTAVTPRVSSESVSIDVAVRF